jgi:hypothetical protein
MFGEKYKKIVVKIKILQKNNDRRKNHRQKQLLELLVTCSLSSVHRSLFQLVALCLGTYFSQQW